jgi:hypothetical protein
MLTQVTFRNPFLWIPSAFINCFMSTLVVFGSFKGTVARDFLPPIFFMKKSPWSPYQPLTFFSNLVSSSPSYLNLNLTFRFIMQRGVKSCRCMMKRGAMVHRCMMLRGVMVHRCIMQRGVMTPRCMQGIQILPLHDAAGSQISPLHDTVGSHYWQRGVKSKSFGRLTKTLK